MNRNNNIPFNWDWDTVNKMGQSLVYCFVKNVNEYVSDINEIENKLDVLLKVKSKDEVRVLYERIINESYAQTLPNSQYIIWKLDEEVKKVKPS